VSRYYYETGRIANSLNEDADVTAAKEILLDKTKYNNILTAKK
jgi:hypothetical protein